MNDRLSDYLNNKFGFENRWATRVAARKHGIACGVIFFIFTCAVSLKEDTYRLTVLLLLSHFFIPFAILLLFILAFSHWYRLKRKQLVKKHKAYDGYSRGIADAAVSFIQYFYFSYVIPLVIFTIFMMGFLYDDPDFITQRLLLIVKGNGP